MRINLEDYEEFYTGRCFSRITLQAVKKTLTLREMKYRLRLPLNLFLERRRDWQYNQERNFYLLL